MGCCSVLMLQGTGSDCGKSVLCAGLVRAFRDMGLRALPFKPQNMSNNAAVTVDGGEIGRAQALQAMAAGVDAVSDMNPILLKPQGGVSQIIVQGRYWGEATGRDYYGLRSRLWGYVEESFRRLCEDADIVIVEGAGSASEVNLRAGDMANMGFAEAFGIPVIIVGDIERGGVIANLVGTYHVLCDAERSLVSGYIINKFRGDASLFDEGLETISEATGWASFGVVPWLDSLGLLPQEDALGLHRIRSDSADESDSGMSNSGINIGVLGLRHIANFDDLDALRAESSVSIHLIEAGESIPCGLDLLLLPGSKATVSDYRYMCEQGWDIDLHAYVRRGGRVIGLCGGYQLLGRSLSDPLGMEGDAETVATLGLLDVTTVLGKSKHLRETRGKELCFGTEISGYEIHLGNTTAHSDNLHPFIVGGESDSVLGYMSADKRIMGCYVHGIFCNDDFRGRYLRMLAAEKGAIYEKSYSSHSVLIESILDELAVHVGRHCDLHRLRGLARVI